MAQKNDDRIMQLKEQIEKKREELAISNTSRFIPITNCLLVIDKTTYNLHVDSSELLLIKLNSMRLSAKDLGIDINKLMISGYSLDNWITDVKNNLSIQNYRTEKKKLDSLEKQLTALLSDDKQTELQIDQLAALLQ